MCSISGKEEPANPHFLRQTLMHLVWSDIRDLKLVRGRGAWQHLLESSWEALCVFFFRQIWRLAVGDTPQPIFAYFRCHKPVFLVYNEV